MFGRRRDTETSLEDYLIESNRIVKQMKHKYGIIDWDVLALRHHFGWAGHVSRLSTDEPDRLTGKS